MSSSVEATVAVGEIIGGKYRVERLLGVGGMGMVLAARHLELDQPVAIKLLLSEIMAEPSAVARFYREAKAAVNMQSEHVARVFDVGRLPSGVPYMVMEFLQGTDLAAWLTERGRLPVGQAVDFLLQACVAVAEAHKLGTIHRDLKPANLFCVKRSDGQLLIKVLDFGISKVADASSGSAGLGMTKTTSLLGSPLYMSPEQMSSAKHVDARTDIWALGATFFELVTGQPPFTGSSITELAIKVATAPTPSCRSVQADLPAQADSVIERCLQKDPQRRFASVAELALALLPLAQSSSRPLVERITAILGVGSGAVSEAWSAGAIEAPTRGASTAPAVERSAPPRVRPGAPATLWLIAAGLVAAGVSIFFLSRGLDPASSDLAQSSASVAAAQAPRHVSASPSLTTIPPSPAPVAASAPQLARLGSAPSSSARAPAERTVKTAPPAVRARAGKPSCDPPFYFDARGNRLFKQECL